MDKELAYETNGSVYFRVSKHGKYGTLASLDKSGMQVYLRGDVNNVRCNRCIDPLLPGCDGAELYAVHNRT